MTSKEQKNKKLVRHIFTEIGKGNHQPFMETLSEDFTVHVTGSTPFSGTYRGVKEVTEKMVAPLMTCFETPPKVFVDQLIAEGDYVVLIAHGEGGTAKNGVAYNNTYCHVMRLNDGKLVESTEYYDTALAIEADLRPQS